MLTGEANLIAAGRRILEMGPEMLVIKKGENGVTVLLGDGVANLPAFPLEAVVDPTGAGDSFAGGMMGYLASAGGEVSLGSLKRAAAHGIVVASFCCEAFSLDRTKELSREELDARMAQYEEMLSF